MKKLLKALVSTVSVALLTSAATAQITYVDATSGGAGNTTLTNGGTWDPLAAQGPANDGLWDVRVFGNSGTIFQNAAFGGVDNSHRLLTTVSGLTLGTYDVFAYFWVDTSDWRIQASLTDNPGGDLPLFTRSTVGVLQYAPTGGSTTILSTDPSVNGGVNPFTTAVMVAEGNRALFQANLGQVTGTGFSVFVDDDPAMADGNQRTWYDGIGYSVIPEPTSATFLGLGALLGILALRRRKA
jgi:MYXO-CTERM domain-containing protein